MFKIREWERYKFMINYEHEQASKSTTLITSHLNRHVLLTQAVALLQHQRILERKLPDTLKLSIAKKVENNLFLKVSKRWIKYELEADAGNQPLLVNNFNCEMFGHSLSGL